VFVVTLRLGISVIAAIFAMMISIPVLVIVLPFWAVAFLTRALARLLEPRYPPWAQLIEFDERFGWRPKPKLDTHYLVDDIYQITTDAQGWRGKASIVESDIVVFGDSFAWGYGVDDKDFFPNLHSRPHIKGIGTIGYNMVQELLWLKDLSSQLRGKLIVWFVYFGNDLWENLTPHMYGYRMPFVRELNGSGDWEIVSSHIARNRWFFKSPQGGRIYYEKLVELCAPTPFSARAYSASRFLLNEGKHVCDSVGSELVVMSIPEKIQFSDRAMKRYLPPGTDSKSRDPDFPDQQMEKICKELGIPFIAVKKHLNLSHYKEHDCHWNEAGYRRVAEILRMEWNRRGGNDCVA